MYYDVLKFKIYKQQNDKISFGQNYTLKPAGYAYKLLSGKLINGYYGPKIIPQNIGFANIPEVNRYFYSFVTPENETILILWNNLASYTIELDYPQQVTSFDQYYIYDGTIVPIQPTKTGNGVEYTTTIGIHPLVLGIKNIDGDIVPISIHIFPNIQVVVTRIILPILSLFAIGYFVLIVYRANKKNHKR